MSRGLLSDRQAMRAPSRAAWLIGFVVGVFLLLLPKLPFPQPLPYPIAPSFALMLVFFWGLDEHARTGAVSVFALGLLEDLLTHTPFGLWAVAFGACYFAALFLRPLISANRRLAWPAFVGLDFVLSLLLWWGIGSRSGLYLPLGGVAVHWLGTCLLFPIAVAGLRWMQAYIYLGAPAVRDL